MEHTFTDDIPAFAKLNVSALGAELQAAFGAQVALSVARDGAGAITLVTVHHLPDETSRAAVLAVLQQHDPALTDAEAHAAAKLLERRAEFAALFATALGDNAIVQAIKTALAR